ncbi:MAG: BMP family ABC transporter substrate-binding protein, partial [Chloroflexota bacterium]
PDVEVQFAFIESWFDPPKAIESATAQIAAGADFIYSQPIGPIEACMDAGVWCAGNYVDQNDLGPEVVLTSNLILWEPHWNTIIDAWWDHVANGVPYDAPTEAVMFRLAEGGTDIVVIDDKDGAIPAEVIDQVMAIRQQMIDGSLVVEFNPDMTE